MKHKIQQKKGFWKWIPLIVLSFALTIIILDTTILNVSLRTIINDLHTNIQSIQWVITAYSLMLAAFTVTGGRLGDLFGRKKMFVLGAVIFAIGSFMTSISHAVWFMILGEAIVEGIGASLMLPATTSLLVSNYKGRDRQIGFGIWGGIAAGAAALGPVVGGWLTTYLSWRWAFRINVGVAALLILGSYFITEIKDKEEKPSLDIVGVGLSAFGLLSIVFGFIESSTYGFLTMKQTITILGMKFMQGSISFIPFTILIGLILLVIFGFWENHLSSQNKTPLVSLKLFKNSQFTVAVAITSILALGQSGLSFVVPVFLQAVKHLNPLDTGFAMLPMTLTILVAAPFSAFISKYIPPKRIIQIGLICDALGFLALAAGIQVSGSPLALTPGFILFGTGIGFMMSQTTNLALSAVSVEEAGQVSGVNGTLRTVGQTLGSAVMGAVLISVLTSTLTTSVNTSNDIPNTIKSTLSQTVSQQTSNIEFGSGLNVINSGVTSKISNQVTRLSEQATVHANHVTLLLGVAFILLALFMSTKLPGGKNIEVEKSIAVGN
jgi:EmrB/QacA subfamily drug resistance transporter